MKKMLLLIALGMIISRNAQAEDFVSIREKIHNAELTDLQRRKIIQPYIGKKVIWQGWVYDVTEQKNRYICQVDMDPPKTLFSVSEFDIQIDENLAMQLNKGQVVYVAGVIQKIESGMFFTVTLANQTLLLKKPDIGSGSKERQKQ